jgi:hypothetical protein
MTTFLRLYCNGRRYVHKVETPTKKYYAHFAAEKVAESRQKKEEKFESASFVEIERNSSNIM